MLLWLVLLLLSQIGTGITRTAHHTQQHQGGTWAQDRNEDAGSQLLRPHIHYCRSPNMETFTCWWRLPSNASYGNNNVTFSLTYVVGKGLRQECPDYVTGGANSCYFNSRYTQVWEIYCMNVTAQSGRGTYTSEEHCLDVADIVETDPPFNLTYCLTNTSAEESGRTAVVSWQYPIAEDVQMGWVSLIYELQFRRKSEPNNWKVKGILQDPRLELLDLPAGSYVVRVRCKSRNSGLWSKWSLPLTITIPPRQAIDKVLSVILVMGLGVMAFLIISFGVIPQRKRIKAFLLPPIPKPRISGIDTTLLKKGKMEEINRLFSSFHGYAPPQCSEETWLPASLEEERPSTRGPSEERGPKPTTPSLTSLGSQPLLHAAGNSLEEPPAALPLESNTHNPARTESLNSPVLGYSDVISPAIAQPISSDFYTCVNGVSAHGEVHLVLCPPDHSIHAAYQLGDPGKKVVPKTQPSAFKARGAAPAPGGVARAAGGNYTTMEQLNPNKGQNVGMPPSQRDVCGGVACKMNLLCRSCHM